MLFKFIKNIISCCLFFSFLFFNSFAALSPRSFSISVDSQFISEMEFVRSIPSDLEYSYKDDKNKAYIVNYYLGKDIDECLKAFRENKLDSEVIARYEFLKKIAKLQHMIEAKIVILFLVEDSCLSLQEINSVRLNVLDYFYNEVNLIEKYYYDKKIRNDFVSKTLELVLKQKSFYVKNRDILKVDFYNYFPSLCNQYIEIKNSIKRLKNNFLIFDKGELNDILNKCMEQREIITKISFNDSLTKKILGSWGGVVPKIIVQRIMEAEDIILEEGFYDKKRKDKEYQLKNSIKIFDAIIADLLEINNKIENIEKQINCLNLLNDFKKEIFIMHSVLIQQKLFEELKNDATCQDAIKQYLEIIKSYLQNNDDQQNRDFFIYNLYSIIFELKKLKSDNNKLSLCSFLFGNDTAKKDNLLFIISGMIEILEMINAKLNNNSGNLVSTSGLYDLAKKVVLSDNVQSWILGAINS